ncbi:MAG TPA: XRE family transcriptional regulator [Kofleriaceae bacterium]|nr:XRE family transcriptional regulator [Kofleriaceae bacterium]
MDTIVDGASTRLASTIKAEREARGWSQADLAARSGVSKAMISKVERAEASPTAAILVRLAAAFELTLATLLMRTEAHAGRHVAAAAQPVWRDPETGYVRRQLFASPSSPMELVRVELPPGARVPIPAASYTFIRQVVWLLEGDLVIEDGAERHALAAGDTYAFGEPADAAFVNDGGAPCVYLVAVSRR